MARERDEGGGRDERVDAEVEAALEGVDLQSLDTQPGKGLHRATVVGVSGDDVIVELGPRAQGVVPLAEFEERPSVGARLEVSLRGREDDLWLCSVRAAQIAAADAELAVGALVKAKVGAQNTGGLEATVGRHRAFLPASQVGLGHVADLAQFLGQTLLCEITELGTRGRMVLSRRAVLERERAETRSQSLSALAPGQVVRGKVTRIEPYGAFVDIGGGLEGMVHVSNLARRRVELPEEVVAVGQSVEAQVLEIQPGGKRIALGMKQLEPDPWDEAPDRFPPDVVLTARVTRLADFGAFVELAPGIEGLLHVSQLGRDRVRRARDVLRTGEEVVVRVVSVDLAKRRIALSRLDARGALLGSEEAADAGSIDAALQRASEPLKQSLGDLLRRARDRDR